jgi:ABC-type nitrate/sulfonate/bicarbonate transport system permease component
MLKKEIVALKIASSAAFIIGILLAAFLWGQAYIKILVVFLICISIILVISIFIKIKRSKQKIKRSG